MFGADGWTVLDFEGEPGRPIRERRRKRSPLRDVAGMLRSFTYAALASELLHGGPPAPEGWEARARERFLDGYLAGGRPRAAAGGRARRIAKLLTLFELEKVLYELRYELDNRPDWLAVPVAAIVRLLEEPLVTRVTLRSGDDSPRARRCSRAASTPTPTTCSGAHPAPDGVRIRAWRPARIAVTRARAAGASVALRADPPGRHLRGHAAPGAALPLRYQLEVALPRRQRVRARRPLPRSRRSSASSTCTSRGEGRHEELYARLGAHPRELDGVAGTVFAVWAPVGAQRSSVVGEFNSWDGRLHPMRSLGRLGDLGAVPARRRRRRRATSSRSARRPASCA